MAQEEECPPLIDLSGCRCVDCKGVLTAPVQLSACMHILCGKCCERLESRFPHNIKCPLCGLESAKPSSFRRISDVNSATAVRRHDEIDKVCDNCSEKATCTCFKCGANLCGKCRTKCRCPMDPSSEHYKIEVSKPDLHGIFEDTEPSRTAADNLDGTPIEASVQDDRDYRPNSLEMVALKCPVCLACECPHTQIIGKLDLGLYHNIPDAFCNLATHKKDDGSPLPKNYFCRKCWLPVCEKCSKPGDCKDHSTTAMEKMRVYLLAKLCDLQSRANMLLTKADCDERDERRVENFLGDHVSQVEEEMYDRKVKILEEVKDVFDRALKEAKHEGRDIVRVYRDNLKETIGTCEFLRTLSEALNNIEIEEKFDICQYVFLLNLLPKAEQLIDDITKPVMMKQRPKEMKLVLSGLDSLNLNCTRMSTVGKECKQPPMSNFFELLEEDLTLVHSIVVINSEECVITGQVASHVAKRTNDMLVHYQLHGNKWMESVKEVPSGRHYLTRLNSGELIAAYADTPYSIKYSKDHSLFSTKNRNDFNQYFHDITHLTEFESQGIVPRGIAATKQNTILLCLAVLDVKKGLQKSNKDKSLVILMSLQGKQLFSAVGREGSSMNPNCVAVSDEGEVCVCDPENSTLAIYDSKLKNEKRLKYDLPTSISRDVQRIISSNGDESDIKFRPESACYDSYGRILVADSNNHMVVRLSRAHDNRDRYEMEPLIYSGQNNVELPQFRNPKLLALGDDGQLWVVCRQYVCIFDYGV